MAYDLGDIAALAIQIKDATGTLANASSVTATITLPDGTTATPSVSNPTTGNYQIAYLTTQLGRHGLRWTASGSNAGAFTDVFEVTDPAYWPIVSLDDMKTHLNITSSTYDEEIRFMISVATNIAENYCKRALTRQTVSETRDGGGTSIILFQPPVLSITSIVENTTTLTASDYTTDLASGIVYRGSQIARLPFFPGRQNITITYVAGYVNPPPMAQHTVKEIVRWMWQTSQQGPRPGFGQSGQEITSFGSDALPTWLLRPLDTLKLPGIS
jgi:hypothetical protein